MECDYNLFQTATLIKTNPFKVLSSEFWKIVQRKSFIERLLIFCDISPIFLKEFQYLSKVVKAVMQLNFDSCSCGAQSNNDYLGYRRNKGSSPS